MPTNDERREVARKLRGAKYSRHSWERYLYDAIGADLEISGSDMLELLADLIDTEGEIDDHYDERREVANRIRSVVDGPVHIDRLVNALGLAYYARGKLIGFYVSESSVRHLADLIEPEPERTCRVKPVGNSYMCLACRAVTDKKAVSGMSSSFCVNYCPNCGAKIVGVKLVGE